MEAELKKMLDIAVDLAALSKEFDKKGRTKDAERLAALALVLVEGRREIQRELAQPSVTLN